MIEIVRGDVNQLEEIVGLNRKVFQGMYGEEPYSLDYYIRKLADKKPVVYVARDTDDFSKIIGDSISFERDNSWYIWILCVDETYRCKGIGSELLKENEQFARDSRFNFVAAKVYNVSSVMQRLLIKRDYHIIGVTVNETDSEQNAIHFRLRLNH